MSESLMGARRDCDDLHAELRAVRNQLVAAQNHSRTMQVGLMM
jgi:hypothetical protein